MIVFKRAVFVYFLPILVIVNWSMVSLFAQEAAKTAATEKEPPISAGVKTVLDTLADVSPELHADALFLLVESNQKLDRATKLKFLQEAYSQAATVSVSIKMAGGIMLLSTDTDAGTSSSAYDRKLDRLSLLSRYLIDLASLDPAEARHLLATEIRLPEMPAVGCEQALVYDPKPYYAALKVVAAHSPNLPSEQPGPSTIDLLTPAVNQLQTHTQVPLILQLLNEAGLSTPALEALTSTFIAQLNKLQGDERSFSAEMLGNVSMRNLNQLYERLETADPGFGAALLKEFRRYLVNNYRAGGCGEIWKHLDFRSDGNQLIAKVQSWRPSSGQNPPSLPGPISEFNTTFTEALHRTGLAPISFDEIDTDTPEIRAEVHHYGQTEEEKSLHKAAQQLRFTEDDNYRSDSDRASSTWQAQAISFLGKVDDWQADPSRSVEVFYEKSTLYGAPVDLAPQPELRWLAIEKNISMLENSDLESQNPALWMNLVMNIRLRTRYLGPTHDKKMPIADLTKRFIRSSSPSLRLIGYLDALGIDPFSSGPLGR